MFQHQICVGFNPARVVVGSQEENPLEGLATVLLALQSMDLEQAKQDHAIEQAQKELLEFAEPLCKTVKETGLPPLLAINHTIPLIDPKLRYPWWPSKWLDAM